MKEGVQMSFGMILDLLIMACGVYMVYWAVQMRSTNEIPAMLVGKGFPVSRAKDPEGFIRYTGLRGRSDSLAHTRRRRR